MIDRVMSHCHKCGKGFETWLTRGEIAPALCLECWFRTPPGSGPGPSQAQNPRDSDSPLSAEVIGPSDDLPDRQLPPC